MEVSCVYSLSTKIYCDNILSTLSNEDKLLEKDIDNIIKKYNFTNDEIEYFLNNSRNIEYTKDNVRSYLCIVDEIGYDKHLADNNCALEPYYFYEYIFIKYCVKKLCFLEYIYDLPYIEDIARRVVGGFERCVGMDYSCNRFDMTDESFDYIGKFYNHKFEQIVCEDNYNITNKALLKYNPKMINVRDCNITDDGIKHMTNLEELYVICNKNITDTALENLSNLKILNIGGYSGITNEGLKKLNNLTELTPSSDITGDGLIYLKKLKIIDLKFNEELSDIDIKYLENLEEIDLRHNEKITINGLKELKNLKKLDIRNNKNIKYNDLLKLYNYHKIEFLVDDENLLYDVLNYGEFDLQCLPYDEDDFIQ